VGPEPLHPHVRGPDVDPDILTLHTGKIYSIPLHISRFVLFLLRQHHGAAATTLAQR
jgi:hypothetical protein